MGRDDTYRFELSAHPGWSNGAARYDDGLAAQHVGRPAHTGVSPGRSPSPEPSSLPPPVAPFQRLPSPHRHTRYDAAGNLTKDGIYSYSWDYENRLTRVKLLSDGSDVAEYTYHALGRRVEKIDRTGESDVTTRYCQDGWSTVEERDGDDALQATYVNGASLDEYVLVSRNPPPPLSKSERILMS